MKHITVTISNTLSVRSGEVYVGIARGRGAVEFQVAADFQGTAENPAVDFGELVQDDERVATAHIPVSGAVLREIIERQGSIHINHRPARAVVIVELDSTIVMVKCSPADTDSKTTSRPIENRGATGCCKGAGLRRQAAKCRRRAGRETHGRGRAVQV